MAQKKNIAFKASVTPMNAINSNHMPMGRRAFARSRRAKGVATTNVVEHDERFECRSDVAVTLGRSKEQAPGYPQAGRCADHERALGFGCHGWVAIPLSARDRSSTGTPSDRRVD